jgi:hypothetical protein
MAPTVNVRLPVVWLAMGAPEAVRSSPGVMR